MRQRGNLRHPATCSWNGWTPDKQQPLPACFHASPCRPKDLLLGHRAHIYHINMAMHTSTFGTPPPQIHFCGMQSRGLDIITLPTSCMWTFISPVCHLSLPKEQRSCILQTPRPLRPAWAWNSNRSPSHWAHNVVTQIVTCMGQNL